MFAPSEKKKKNFEREKTHFCDDCDRSKGIPKVYSYDGLQGWYFYRILCATIRELSIERHSQALMGLMGGMCMWVVCYSFNGGCRVALKSR